MSCRWEWGASLLKMRCFGDLEQDKGLFTKVFQYFSSRSIRVHYLNVSFGFILWDLKSSGLNSVLSCSVTLNKAVSL